jgi:diaminopimelate epimerase
MKLLFSKYQGTGNDFILVNNLSDEYNWLTISQIKNLCHRKFGIGSDGFIKISQSNDFAFKMDFYNPDGTQSFCGNGSRCAIAFVESLGINVSEIIFEAIDGNHLASKKDDIIKIQMGNVNYIKSVENDFELNTGSPHYVKLWNDISSTSILNFGKSIRNSKNYKADGINVNLIKGISSSKIEIASYERGVEDETLSCGTGATACALVWDKIQNSGSNFVDVKVKGGELKIEFKRDNYDGYENIFLSGPANFIYSGEIDITN